MAHSTETATEQTVGVVVLFEPPDGVGARLRAMEEGGLPMIAVYNAFEQQVLNRLRQQCEVQFVCFEQNVGLAKALNAGIECARVSGATRVILFDQDSEPDADLARRLGVVLDTADQAGLKVAAVGPTPLDVKDMTVLRDRDPDLLLDTEWSEPATVITSGMLIPLRALDAIGPMWEDLFIDDIDHEWCWRARMAGWTVIQARNVFMAHNLGDTAVKVFGKFKGVHRSPGRHYHIVRNTLAMMRIKGVPLRWRATEGLKTLYRVPVYIAASRDRRATLRALSEAVRDHARLWRTRPEVWR